MSQFGILEGISAGVAGLKQKVQNTTNAAFNIGTVIPLDNTIPQITEGSQILTLPITPTSATSRLYIEATISGVFLAGAVVDGNFTMALFQDGAANAISSELGIGTLVGTSGSFYSVKLTHTMIAGTTAPTTFEIRGGVNAAPGVLFINRTFYGPTVFVTFTILEV